MHLLLFRFFVNFAPTILICIETNQISCNLYLNFSCFFFFFSHIEPVALLPLLISSNRSYQKLHQYPLRQIHHHVVMEQNKREKEIACDWSIKAECSLSEAAVKVGSRATFASQAASLLVYKHTNTHSLTHTPHI